MKKIFFVIFGFMLAMISVSSCKYAPKEELGDTVAASVFDVFDTQNKPAKPKKAQTAVKDSACIFVIGDGSDRHTLHLLSFPSRRDTFTYGKARHEGGGKHRNRQYYPRKILCFKVWRQHCK